MKKMPNPSGHSAQNPASAFPPISNKQASSAALGIAISQSNFLKKLMTINARRIAITGLFRLEAFPGGIKTDAEIAAEIEKSRLRKEESLKIFGLYNDAAPSPVKSDGFASAYPDMDDFEEIDFEALEQYLEFEEESEPNIEEDPNPRPGKRGNLA